MLIAAIVYRDVSTRLFFTEPEEAKLLRTLADDLCWLAEQEEGNE